MADLGETLAQIRPSNTTATSAYSPGSSVRTKITRVLVCNTTASPHDFRIFLDVDGTTYDETTALFFDEALAANTTREIEGNWWLDKAAGNLAVRTDTNDAFTFTVFGIEYQI